MSIVKQILKKVDEVLLGLCVISSLYGLILICSATRYLESYRPVLVQAVSIFIGVMLYFVFSAIDINYITGYPIIRYLLFLFNVGFIALLLTSLGRDDGTGNVAWLYAKWMPTSIQPSEIVKISYTVLLAYQLAWVQNSKQMRGVRSIFWPFIHMLFMFVWIYIISGDAGSGLIYIAIYAGMVFAAGIAWYWVLLGISIAGVCITGLIVFDKFPNYMLNRIIVIFDHSFSPDKVGYQQGRSIMAIGSGGLWGQGLFNGLQTQSTASSSLPARHTDFIFAVCGEELGFVGCLAIITLEFMIVYRCFRTAAIAGNTMNSLICIGFGSMLIIQTIENIGMCLFVMPVIGVTLPFFSYGGSSIITLYTAMGIISGIRCRIPPNWLRR